MFHRRVRLISPHPPAELARRLRAQTEKPSDLFATLKGEHDRGAALSAGFRGTVGETDFEIQRKIGYRNAFLPQINGAFAAHGAGSRVEIVFWLHPLIGVFVLLWLGLSAYIAIKAVLGPPATMQLTAATSAIFLVSVGFFAMGFVPEMLIARRRLCEILDAAPAGEARTPIVGH